jgi:hypothetical protein
MSLLNSLNPMKLKTFASILIPACIALDHLAAAELPVVEVANKSSFELDANSRNPFWPINFKPTGQVTRDLSSEQDAGTDIPVTAFTVSSITIERTARFAIINGRIMEEGQQFGLQMGTHTYLITLRSVQDGRVILERRKTQEMVVPLRRK